MPKMISPVRAQCSNSPHKGGGKAALLGIRLLERNPGSMDHNIVLSDNTMHNAYAEPSSSLSGSMSEMLGESQTGAGP